MKIRALVLKIKDFTVSELKEKLETANEVEQKRWTENVYGLTKFLAIKSWFSNFVQRHNIRICIAHGEAAFISEKDTGKCATELLKILCFFDCEEVTNTNEVGILFRSLQSKTINPTDTNTDRKPLKKRLTVVITVFADGRKDSLVIIGPSRIPKGFSRWFDAVQDLVIHSYLQKQSCNTEEVWSDYVGTM